ncbi:MAG: guanylate kinase, partial [Phaeodactylibacter sp.]|nr:guanylate kinase [Phaeodactylibacter sp.]
APSGAGKTTIVRHLLAVIEELAFSVSATSRSRRPNEKDGVDYYFYDAEAFRELLEADAFVEWEEVYEGQFYGTLRSEVERLWGLHKHIIFDIDVKGAVNLKQQFGDRALSVFVKPPSREVLFERLRNRKTEDPASLKKRMARADDELAFENKFDTVLVNDVLEVALVEAERQVRQFLKL